MAGTRPVVNLPYTRLDESDFEYDMRHRGYRGSRGRAIIFSHDIFDKELGLPQRPDVKVMRSRLHSIFRFVGFQNQEITYHENKKGREMIEILHSVAKETDFSNMDCLIVIILSHGDDNCNVYSHDILLTYEMLMEPLKVAELKDLPKIFMVQASPAKSRVRPDEVRGPVMEHDAAIHGSGSPYPLYKATDFLLIYSLLKGTSFVDAFCEVMRADGRRLEIIQIISRVARMMSYPPLPTPKPAPRPNKNFPSPYVISMMSKAFYFS